MNLLPSLVKIFGSLKTTVWCLVWLIVLTFWGTLHQASYGLNDALDIFFNSWVLFPPEKYADGMKAGGGLMSAFSHVPLPGGMLTMAVFFVNLVISFFVHFILGWRMAGLVVSHLGLLLLLGGGFLNKMTGKDGYVYLREGEGTNVMTAYKDWEISIWKDQEMPREVHAISTDGFRPGDTFHFDNWGLSGTVDTYYVNATAYLRGKEVPDPPESVSKIVSLEEKPPEKEPEMHVPGGVFTFVWKGETRKILLYGMDTTETEWAKDGESLFLSLRRKRSELPVYIELQDFRREFYPGTQTARSYSSLIDVHFSNDQERNALVEMNRPFRHQGYTFFQASFSTAEQGGEGSKFAVTVSVGRLLPYIATGVTFVGLAWHFLTLMLVGKGRSS